MRISAQWTLDGAATLVSRPAIVAFLTTGAVAVPSPLASIPSSFDSRPVHLNPAAKDQSHRPEFPAPAFGGVRDVRAIAEGRNAPRASINLSWSPPEPVALVRPPLDRDTDGQASTISRAAPLSTPAAEEPRQLVAAIDEARQSEGRLQTTQLNSLEQSSSSQLPDPQGTARAMPSAELKSMMRKVAYSRVGESDPKGVQTMEPSRKSASVAPLKTTSPVDTSASSGLVNIPQRVSNSSTDASSVSETSGSEVSRYRSTSQGIEFEVPLSVNGSQAGKVSLLIADSENISVQLGGLLSLLEPMMDASEFDRMSASQSARDYVTLNELRAAGLAVSFDKHDRLRLGTS